MVFTCSSGVRRTSFWSAIRSCAVDSIPRICAAASLLKPYLALVNPRNVSRSRRRSRASRFMSASRKAWRRVVSDTRSVCEKSRAVASYWPIGSVTSQEVGIRDAKGDSVMAERSGLGIRCKLPLRPCGVCGKCCVAAVSDWSALLPPLGVPCCGKSGSPLGWSRSVPNQSRARACRAVCCSWGFWFVTRL